MRTPPPAITAGELRMKLDHLSGVLAAGKYNAIALYSEGSLRWLTGLKQQLGDIAPFAVSPVNALVLIKDSGGFKITIIAKPFEMPRLRSEVPPVFDMVPDIEYGFLEQMPSPESGTAHSTSDNYQQMVDQIIRPLLGGVDSNSYSKLSWLSGATMKVLSETAQELEPGMNGLAIRGRMLCNLARAGIDANLVLIALSGQETHLHPIASAQYQVEKGKWMKLVVGTRYAEHIVSQSLMVKLGGSVSDHEAEVYRALQQASVEYADLYREGTKECDIYAGMIERFRKVEHDFGLKGFAQSAVLHHPGGGTSPLGNRDRMIDPSGIRTCEAWTQFAINPVDTLCGLKVELQGIIQPSGAPPVILDMHRMAPALSFSKIKAEGGTTTVLPDLFIV